MNVAQALIRNVRTAPVLRRQRGVIEQGRSSVFSSSLLGLLQRLLPFGLLNFCAKSLPQFFAKSKIMAKVIDKWTPSRCVDVGVIQYNSLVSVDGYGLYFNNTKTCTFSCQTNVDNFCLDL